MKTIFLGLVISAVVGCGATQNSDMKTMPDANDAAAALTIAFDQVRPGVEYPTDSGVPAALSNKKVLVISNSDAQTGNQRIVVDSEATLSDPIGGADFPTDAPVPVSLVGKKILVFGNHRFVIDIQTAQAGVDFPTDGPGTLDRDFLVWAFSTTNRLVLSQMSAFEKAQAGVDYPTDGPAGMNRDFYVAVTVDANGDVVRTSLR